MALVLKVGDKLTLKKQHPCGGKEWAVLRTGADFRIQCLTCQRQVWIERKELERRVRSVLREGQSYKPQELDYQKLKEEKASTENA